LEKSKNNNNNIIQKRRRIKNLITLFLSDPVFRIGFILFAVILFTMVSFFFFEKDLNNSNIKNLYDSFWYTIVTLTTVGYGDITPVTVLGRIVGLTTMLFGVIFVAAVTGKIASFLVDRQLRRGKGLLKLKNLQNHFIICGFRPDFENIIDDVLESNPEEIDISDIVLINNAPTEYMEQFMANPKYKLINYIHGDFIDESVLSRANIKSAKRVLVLSDHSDDFSQMEMDSRTIMAVMTISKVNRSIYTVAELLDETFEKYLIMAHCDEIILSRQYERKLIVNASSGSGISHVIRDLMSIDNDERIFIVELPKSYIGISFKNAFDYFGKEKKTILIGLLENTGNFYARKKEALTDAQKTPDISTLVGNLQKVKELRANNPILNPGFDYIVKNNSMAILIGKPK